MPTLHFKGKTFVQNHPLAVKYHQFDVEENLVVLMLMLPSANRQNKETLKVFRDQGGFIDFFPREDDFEGHKKLKELIPNLDCFTTEMEVFGTQIKTLLGNTLKVLRPLIDKEMISI